jgi:repressor LexA
VYIIHVGSVAYTVVIFSTRFQEITIMEIYSEDSFENSLTEKQAKVLQFIESHYLDSGTSPTYEEIARKFKWNSVNSVTNHIAALREKGFISLTKGRNRHVTPLRVNRKLDNAGSKIPLLGNIAAGAPIEAVENVDSWMDLDALGITNERRDKFALRVKGNSMINRGIRSNDIVIVQRQSFVTQKDVAAVRIGSDVTLKYVKQEANCIKLIPDNDFMAPITVNADQDLQVIGKVVRLFREDI